MRMKLDCREHDDCVQVVTTKGESGAAFFKRNVQITRYTTIAGYLMNA